jgi:hypothetical protein
MALRYHDYEVVSVQPPSKEKLVWDALSFLIDLAYLRDTTVEERLQEFATTRGIVFSVKLVGDVGVRYRTFTP